MEEVEAAAEVAAVISRVASAGATTMTVASHPETLAIATSTTTGSRLEAMAEAAMTTKIASQPQATTIASHQAYGTHMTVEEARTPAEVAEAVEGTKVDVEVATITSLAMRTKDSTCRHRETPLTAGVDAAVEEVASTMTDGVNATRARN